MILFHAPRSPFARKARIVVHELALEAVVEMRVVDPWTDESLRALNPLCKVPTLQLDDGTTLFDSQLICEYLDRFADGRLFTQAGPERWNALRRQALASGLADAVIRRHVSSLDLRSDRLDGALMRQGAAIDAVMRELEREYTCPKGRPFDIGDAAVVAALGYFQFRSPDLAERYSAPRLKAWQAWAEQRPSCVATRIEPP